MNMGNSGGGGKWIQGAIKHPGALTRKAKAAGQSPMVFAEAHKGSKGTTGKQARLALTLRRMHERKTASEPGASKDNVMQKHMLGTGNHPMCKK